MNRELVSRLLIGALSEHEQRRLVIAHLGSSATFRRAFAKSLRWFEVLDADAMARYASVLAEAEPKDLEQERSRLLAVSRQRLPSVQALGRAFTFEDLYGLGPATRRLVSWTAAELFIERALRPETLPTRKRVDLRLALMIIDVVELLGAAGVAPHYPSVGADVVRRIDRASRELEESR